MPRNIPDDLWGRAVEFLSKAAPGSQWDDGTVTMWLCVFHLAEEERQMDRSPGEPRTTKQLIKALDKQLIAEGVRGIRCLLAQRTDEASPDLEPISKFRDELRQMICEGEFDFTKIFEEITYEGEVYADLSNEGADALADYFIGLFEMIDEQRRDAAPAVALED